MTARFWKYLHFPCANKLGLKIFPIDWEFLTMTVIDTRIVIIVDDAEDELLLRRHLPNSPERNYIFQVARNGEEGLRATLAPSPPEPDCVIVDLHLPDMSGLELINSLKDSSGNILIPIVLFIDGGDQCQAASEALRAGAQDYIARSWITSAGLACAVENAIERFDLRTRLREKRTALDRKDREFKTLVENSPDIITRFNTDFRHIYVNPAIERATGLPMDQFLGKTSREAGMPADDCDFWEAKLQEVLDTNKVVTFEFNLQSPQGKRDYQSRLVPEFSNSGAVESILGVSTDISERKRAEEAVQAGAEQVRNVIDSLFAFVGVLTPDGILIQINRPALEAGGLKPEEILGRPFEESFWWGACSPDVQKNLRQAIQLASKGERYRDDLSVQIAGGQLMVVDFMLAPLVDSKGNVTHLIPSAIDVTKRVKAEEALRETEKRFQRFATSDIIGIAFGDILGGLSYVNDEFLRILAYSRQEFEANRMSWTQITPPDLLSLDEFAVAEAKLRGSCTPYEKEFIRKNGSRVPVFFGFTLVAEDKEEIIAFILDTTERKRFEAALKDADKRKDEFLAMLAHELRNPLAAIRSAVHLLRLKSPSDPNLEWSRDVIERQVKHLTRLIDDLLDVSRITTGKIQLKTEALDLAHILARAVESVRPLLDAKQHELRILLPPDPLPAQIDAARIEQVIGNLLTNAAKYTDKGGEITLSASREGPSVVVKVRDNGVGISPETLPHVFSLFTQADSTLDRAQGGLGIGLTLVKSLVEMHGGHVSAESPGLGRGSEFTVSFPALKLEPTPPPEPLPEK